MNSRTLRAVSFLSMMPFLTATGDELKLFAAGSLRAALGEVADAFEKSEGNTKIERIFGPSGLLRERIENGDSASVFASASMRHAMRLHEDDRGGPVTLFARNRLCGLARQGVEISSETFLSVLLDPNIRVGTSTPKLDPAGDYAWELFKKAELISPGAYEVLDRKAIKLTGGAESEIVPEGRNPYAWIMENRRADVFLTYCTNAVLAKKEVPELEIVSVPATLAVGAEYGLVVLNGAPDVAWRFAMFLLSPPGQSILASFGFETCAVPLTE